MRNWNLLILFSYIICVTYVFYRAIKSIDKQLNIKLNKDFLKAQLESQDLATLIGIEFKLKDRYQTDQLRDLLIHIENKSPTASIAVDWDQSCLTDFEGRSRRVIRLMPGMTMDLFQPQVFSVIAPRQTLKESLTAEDILKRNSSGILEIASSLFVPDKLKKASEKGGHFYLSLILTVSTPSASAKNGLTHPVSCQFTVNKLPWTDALDWNLDPPKKTQ